LPGVETLHTKGTDRLANMLAQGVVMMTDHLRAQLSDGTIQSTDDVAALALDPAITAKLRADIEAALVGAHDEARDHAKDQILRRKNQAVDAMIERVTARAIERVRR